MKELLHYQAPNKEIWQGRSDLPPDSCVFQKIKPLNLNSPPSLPPNSMTFAILGFACDEGVKRNQGRIGAKEGPLIFRQVFAKLSIQRQDIQLFDAGDIICNDLDLESAQIALGDAVNLLRSQHIVPIIIGGGHELAWGHYQGLALEHDLSIINFDAHFDMRPLLSESKGSSGTPFLQIANHRKQTSSNFRYHCLGIQPAGNIPLLFKTAKEHHVSYVQADELQHDPDKYLSELDAIIKQSVSIYTSICLDVFASPYAPGVSAPQTLGITPWQAIPFIRKLANSNKVISYDIAELCPQHDIDQRTSKLAASLVYEIIHHHAF